MTISTTTKAHLPYFVTALITSLVITVIFNAIIYGVVGGSAGAEAAAKNNPDVPSIMQLATLMVSAVAMAVAAWTTWDVHYSTREFQFGSAARTRASRC